MTRSNIKTIVNGETRPVWIDQPLARNVGRGRSYGKYEFIMWDGEAVIISPVWFVNLAGDIWREQPYCLFGNTKGDMLCEPRRLTTAELIALLMESAEKYPKTFHFGYGFDYDVDNILWDLPKSKLAYLVYHGKCRHKINGKTYQITYIPRKVFAIAELVRYRDDRGHIREKRAAQIRIDDVVSHFNTRYDKALAKFQIGTQNELERMAQNKDRRQFFLWKDINHIIDYWRDELRLGPLLMDKLRKAIYGAGFHIGMWYGPGAIAKSAMRQYHVDTYMAETSDYLIELMLWAYAGGWFERFGMGFYEGSVWVPDINSAYPWAISQLPSLRNGKWHHIVSPEPVHLWAKQSRMAIFHIRYNLPKAQRSQNWTGTPFPLFQRRNDGSIFHPMAVDNWYHAPEARLVINDPNAEFLEAWVFEDDGTYPFEWVNDMYMLRLALQAEGNEAQLGFKLGLNSLYGSMAQRTGWDRVKYHAPKWHQIEWAGLVTSYCRAMVYQVAADVAKTNSLLSIDTDGIISLSKPLYLPNGEGNQLGRWKVTEYSGILYIQNGVYWLRNMNGEWMPPKTRGISQRRLASIDAGFAALSSTSVFSMERRSYMGFRHALTTDWGKRGQWFTDNLEFHPQYSGSRKHIEFACPVCATGKTLTQTIHPCFLFQHPRAPIDSIQHHVPWRDPDRTEEMIHKFMRMIDEEET